MPTTTRSGDDTSREMIARVRALDWSTTSLGSRTCWSHRLNAVVEQSLAGGFPAIVLWGNDLVQIYNDGYRRLMGDRHPAGLGQATRECWPEVWHINEPLYRRVLKGEAFSFQDALYPINRGGVLEDAWFTLAYSPLCNDEDLICGVLVTVIETTARVLADRKVAAMAERQHHNLQMPGFVAVLSGPDHVYTYVNDAYVQLAGPRLYLDRTVREVFPDLSGQAFFELLDTVYASGESFAARAMPIALNGEDSERFLDFLYEPVRGDDGLVTGIFVGGYDVSDRVRAEARLRDSDASLRALVSDLETQVAERTRERGKTWDVSPHLLSVISLADGRFMAVNAAWTNMPATISRTRCKPSASGQSRSSSVQTPPKASRYCRVVGSSSAPWHGSTATAVSPKTSSRPSLRQPHGCLSHQFNCLHAASQGSEFIQLDFESDTQTFRVLLERVA